jgi:hypothetical protein
MSTLNQKFTLNECIQAIVDVCEVSRQPGDNTEYGSFVRVHLAQATCLRFDPVRLERLLFKSPQDVLLGINPNLGNRERAVKYLMIGRWMLAFYGFTQRPGATLSPQAAVDYGRRAYRLAADASFSFDQDFAEVWWMVGDRFRVYGEVVDATCQYLTA